MTVALPAAALTNGAQTKQEREAVETTAEGQGLTHPPDVTSRPAGTRFQG